MKTNKYFKLPLKLWEYGDVKVFTADDNMAFDFAFSFDKTKPTISISEEQRKKVVDIINGKDITTKENNLSYKDGTMKQKI